MAKMKDDLFHIIENTPISLRRRFKRYNNLTGEMHYLRGMSDIIPYRVNGMGDMVDKHGWSEYGIVLSYECDCCDNMAKTLLHEALHIKYWNTPSMDEDKINELTEVYWNTYPTIRKVAVKRLVYELGVKDL